MIKLEDLKVGDYVGSLWGNGVATVKKINKKSFTTTTGLTIYENEFKDCFVITEEQARASAIHNLNEELKEMNELLKKLQEDFDTFNFDNQYYEINTEALDNKINGILDKIKEKLENEEINTL